MFSRAPSTLPVRPLGSFNEERQYKYGESVQSGEGVKGIIEGLYGSILEQHIDVIVEA